LLENEGQDRTPITYMQTSGDYVSGSYVEDLSIRITPGEASTFDRSIALCDKMLRDDIFELGWRGEVRHSWKADLTKSWADVALDVHSKVSGGSISSGILTLDYGDYLMMPFYGPLPVSGEPDAVSITTYVTAYSGSRGLVYYATETDLSDMTPIDQDGWKVGWNTIYVPGMAGKDFIAIGVKASLVGSLSFSYLKGNVKRYVAPSKIPWADPGESFKVRVASTAGTQVSFLQVKYNDRYFY
jgi:hypothetical protein